MTSGRPAGATKHVMEGISICNLHARGRGKNKQRRERSRIKAQINRPRYLPGNLQQTSDSRSHHPRQRCSYVTWSLLQDLFFTLCPAFHRQHPPSTKLYPRVISYLLIALLPTPATFSTTTFALSMHSARATDDFWNSASTPKTSYQSLSYHSLASMAPGGNIKSKASSSHSERSPPVHHCGIVKCVLLLLISMITVTCASPLLTSADADEFSVTQTTASGTIYTPFHELTQDQESSRTTTSHLEARDDKDVNGLYNDYYLACAGDDKLSTQYCQQHSLGYYCSNYPHSRLEF